MNPEVMTFQVQVPGQGLLVKEGKRTAGLSLFMCSEGGGPLSSSAKDVREFQFNSTLYTLLYRKNNC